jgi:hypothetical protein
MTIDHEEQEMSIYKEISNRFPGTCRTCGNRVEANDGFAQLDVKPAANEKAAWQTQCHPCHDGQTPTPVAPAVAQPTFPPTDEQAKAARMFGEGPSMLAIQAGAGTGKTTTLVLIAKSTNRTATLVAFNKGIVKDVRPKLADTKVTARTINSLAYQQVGKHFKARLDSERMSGYEIARRLDIEPFYCTVGDQPKVVQPQASAGYVMKALDNFCRSAAKAPGTRHLPYVDSIDVADEDGGRTYENNDALAAHLADAIDRAWADIQRVDGQLRFTQDHFVKIWELGELYGPPVIPGEYIMVDEAQDSNPVFLSVLAQQNKQVIFVGDAQQQMYEWRGAVDAMSTVPADATTFLTKSFRFGPEIAGVANQMLARIPSAELRLQGLGEAGEVRECDDPDAILTRTNAAAIAVVIAEAAKGRKVYMEGGAADVVGFARAAKRLMNGESTDHPELAIFDNWQQVQEYVDQDVLGDELAPMVRLIDDNGVDTVLAAADNKITEDEADVTVSTAHKSKGREWDSVRLAGDFPSNRMSDSEYRILYVAVTRARKVLDITGCAAAMDVINGKAGQ